MENQVSAGHNLLSNDHGRRIYVQEQCLARDSLLSKERCVEMLNCALSLNIPRVYSHAASEITLWEGGEVKLSPDGLIANLGYRALQSNYFGSIEINSIDKTKQKILEPGESIVANCYFSNYYTLASSEESAKVMFSDNSSISNIRDIKPGRTSLVSPKMLSLRPNKSNFQEWLYDLDLTDSTKSFLSKAKKEILDNNEEPHIQALLNSVSESASKLLTRMSAILISVAKDLH